MTPISNSQWIGATLTSITQTKYRVMRKYIRSITMRKTLIRGKKKPKYLIQRKRVFMLKYLLKRSLLKRNLQDNLVYLLNQYALREFPNSQMILSVRVTDTEYKLKNVNPARRLLDQALSAFRSNYRVGKEYQYCVTDLRILDEKCAETVS